MSDSIEQFTKYWARFKCDTNRLKIHSDDKPILDTLPCDFNLDMLPIPVVGDLHNASIVIAMLNPGLSPDDPEWEACTKFRNAKQASIEQKFENTDYPFYYLDPFFDEHPGAGYWSLRRKIAKPRKVEQQKLRRILSAMQKHKTYDEKSARRELAHKIVLLQLIPYCSERKPSGKKPLLMKSSETARNLLHGLVSEREKLVIVTRSIHEWGFDCEIVTDRLVVYRANQGAAASLTPWSEGGKAIVRELGIPMSAVESCAG